MLVRPQHAVALVILAVTTAPGVAQVDIEKAKREHWAYQKIANPTPPRVEHADRVHDPIDAFVLARLEANGLTPAEDADRRTLIRRVYFDLIGLPPTFDQVEAFVADTSSDAYAKVVDTLLASPRFGERWGRHWLDVARYADTIGYDGGGRQRKFAFAWTYRDYVIRSFNGDKPYNRFVVEQIAADRLGLGANDPALAGLGLLTVGRQFLGNVHNLADDRIDVVTRGVMGLTVQCARCHDHKYDPVPTADYYAMYGVFRSIEVPEPLDMPVVGEAMGTPEQRKAYEAELAKRTKAVDDHLVAVHAEVVKEARDRGRDYLDLVSGKRENIKNMRRGLRDHYAFVWKKAGAPNPIPDELIPSLIEQGAAIRFEHNRRFFNQKQRDRFNTLRGKIVELQLDSQGAPPRAMVVTDGKPFRPYVFERGQAGSRGENVDRRWLSVLGGDKFKDATGRLELARAVTAPDNPLTARVWANRVWMHLFGEGIVRTPGDFGSRGQPPTHPLLLDHLATRLVDNGWSTKRLIRAIVLSGTYRRSANATIATIQRDPENRWLARQNRRRLAFEPLRDSVLAVAGRLDPRLFGRPVQLFGKSPSNRRAVYGFIDRQDLPQTLRAFDFASPDHSTPRRLETTVPQQAMFMMNSPFVMQLADAVAAKSKPAGDDRIAAIYRIVLSRNPSIAETVMARSYLGESPDEEAWSRFAHTLMQSNEFAFID